MRLRTILVDYPKALLDALEDMGINTPEDLLFSISIDALFRQLAPNTISLLDLSQAREKVISSLAAKGQTALNLLRHSVDRARHDVASRWSVGLPEFDAVLRASKSGCGVIEIAGGKRSGKTVRRATSRMHVLAPS